VGYDKNELKGRYTGTMKYCKPLLITLCGFRHLDLACNTGSRASGTISSSIYEGGCWAGYSPGSNACGAGTSGASASGTCCAGDGATNEACMNGTVADGKAYYRLDGECSAGGWINGSSDACNAGPGA